MYVYAIKYSLIHYVQCTTCRCIELHSDILQYHFRISKYYEVGLLEKWLTNYSSKPSCIVYEANCDYRAEMNPLTVSQLTATFVLLGAGFVTSVIGFYLEFLWKKFSLSDKCCPLLMGKDKVTIIKHSHNDVKVE